MMLRHAIVLLLCASAISSQAQNLILPPEWEFDADEHRLKIGASAVVGLYRTDVIRTMELRFSQPDFWEQLTANQATNTRMPATLIVDGVQYDSVGVRFKGSTSEEIETTLKRSFNISVDHYRPDQHIMGYTTLNLDNSSNDPSFMREVLYSTMIREFIPTSKAGFIHLNINGEDWGLYPNIQQLNTPFLREWFFSNNGSIWRAERPDGSGEGAWGDGTAALNWLGGDTTTYQEFYDLDRTEQIQPWDDLVRVIDKLNNVPLAQLEDTLNVYMNVDRALWFLACEIAFADRSSYVRKGKDDYMLYFEPESGRSTPLEFDGRTTMRPANISWTPFYNADDVNYPLLNRLLSVPSLRQRYLAHLRVIINEKMQSPTFNAMLADHVSLIDEEVQSDPKKLYTYLEFQNEQIALQEFINGRRLTLNSNFEVNRTGPSISGVQHLVGNEVWADPLAGEAVDVRASVSSTNGITVVRLYYSFGLLGPFNKVLMYDDGQHNDGAANDGAYGAAIPDAPVMTNVRYYIEAVSGDAAQTVAYEPARAEHDVFTYTVQHPQMVDPPIRVNELLALNTWIMQDNFLEWDDWIELYNTTAETVDLSGYFLSDNGGDLQKYQFPLGSIIQPYGYMIIWADSQPEQGDNHASFALAADGESVWLSDPQGVVMDHVIFGQQEANIAYARRPNGTGPFEHQDPTFNINNDMVSVGEIERTALVRMYPNPAKDMLTLVSESPLEIVIYDALMRQMYSARLQGRSDIDLSTWAAGTYYVRHAAGMQKLMVIR